jgi:hypothetical protein
MFENPFPRETGVAEAVDIGTVVNGLDPPSLGGVGFDADQFGQQPALFDTLVDGGEPFRYFRVVGAGFVEQKSFVI